MRPKQKYDMRLKSKLKRLSLADCHCLAFFLRQRVRPVGMVTPQMLDGPEPPRKIGSMSLLEKSSLDPVKSARTWSFGSKTQGPTKVPGVLNRPSWLPSDRPTSSSSFSFPSFFFLFVHIITKLHYACWLPSERCPGPMLHLTTCSN